MKIKAIVFDLDNTLIDFMKMKRMCVKNAVDAMIDAGLDYDKEKAVEVFFDMYFSLGIEYQNVFQEFSLEVLGKVDYKIIGAGISAYRKTKIAYVEPYPHVISTLRELSKRGMKLCIVTDAPKIQAWIRLSDMKLHHFFDVVVAFDDTRKLKPDSRPFKKALEELKVKPEECLMVGDWIERDIEGAKKVGMKTCFARYGHIGKMRASKADYEIDDIQEVINIVRKNSD